MKPSSFRELRVWQAGNSLNPEPRTKNPEPLKSVIAWNRLGRFLLLHPCLVLAGVLWATLALFFPTERPGVEIDLDRICEVSGWVRSSLHRLDDRIRFDLQPEQILQGDRQILLPGLIQVHLPKLRIPVKPATQSGESGHPVGAKRRWGFHDVSGGRFESM